MSATRTEQVKNEAGGLSVDPEIVDVVWAGLVYLSCNRLPMPPG